MPFITQGKTNWKFLLILIIIAALVIVLSWWMLKNIFIEGPLIKLPKTDKKYCEKDEDCVFIDFQCCPEPDPCQREPREVVNKDNKEKIEKDLESKCSPICPPYAPPMCSDCLNLEDFSPACINNRCTSKREVNCENYCEALAKDKSKPCPWISNEGLITEENTEKCNCETADCIEKYPVVVFADCVPGEIVDGWWGTILYPNTLDTSNIEHHIDAPAPDIVKQAGIASYGASRSTCQTTWLIKVNGEWKEVSQIEFCNYIVDYNSSCNNCLLEWEEGCC